MTSDQERLLDLERRVEALEHYVEVQGLRGMPKLLCALRNLTVITDKEEALQDAVRVRFQQLSVRFVEQVAVDKQNRFDFAHEGIVIELKVNGGLPALTRQIDRYAALDVVSEVCVVTTKRQHLRLPVEIRGKPVRVVWVGSI